jgi:hypothetical protein
MVEEDVPPNRKPHEDDERHAAEDESSEESERVEAAVNPAVALRLLGRQSASEGERTPRRPASHDS